MRKQELQQIYGRFFNSPITDFMNPPKHPKPQGTLLWNSKTQRTFYGSVRDTFKLSKSKSVRSWK
jgi:hypothetical protein